MAKHTSSEKLASTQDAGAKTTMNTMRLGLARPYASRNANADTYFKMGAGLFAAGRFHEIKMILEMDCAIGYQENSFMNMALNSVFICRAILPISRVVPL